MNSFTSRPCRPEEMSRWAEFLNRNFGYQAPQSYQVDFAPLFEKSALGRSRLIFNEKGAIVASASLYPVVAVTTARPIKLGIIGAVATDESFRGQGLSGRVLAELETEAKRAGLEGLILWSDKNDFYAKAGFVPAGGQEIFSLDTLPKPAALAKGAPAYGWDPVQVSILYTRHRLRVSRTDEHWKAIQEIRSCTRVQWLDETGRVRAYLGFDRGRDLAGIIHEWGGDPEALLSLLWVVRQNRPNLLWMTHPLLDDPISPQLNAKPVMEGALGLFKPLTGSVKPADLDHAWFWGLDSL